MAQRFDTENQQEDAIDPALPYDWFFHNPPEGQSRSSSGEANGRGTGRPSLTNIGSIGLDTVHSSNHSVNPALLHQQPFHHSSLVGPSQFQYRSALIAASDTPRQGPPQVGSSAPEPTGRTITESSRNLYSSRSNLPPLAPALPSPSHIVTARPSTQHQSHASGSAVDRSDPQHTSHFSPSASVQGGHHNTASTVEYPQRRRGTDTIQRLPTSSTSAPATPASVRFHPYSKPDASTKARHGQSSLASLSSPKPVGLQSTPSQNGHFKLSLQEHTSRSKLLRKEGWFKNQAEEPRVTAADEFVKREYINTADKTRFGAFVGIHPETRRPVCGIPHEITIKGNNVPCTYERENVKEAVAHVSVYFGYKGYKCQSTELGHRCDKMFPTRERRNDHYSKVIKGPDPSSTCDKCDKKVRERNMERHKRRCEGKPETESQPER